MDYKKLMKPYQNDLLKDLYRFVEIPSVYERKSVSTNKPYGKNVDKALSAFASFGKEHGFKVERNPHYVELSYGNEGPIIGIYGHLDVVPVQDPKIFKVRKTNNNLYGRGVADDKGPLLAATYAVIALKNQGLIKNAQIKIFAGGNEERGASCLIKYAKTHSAPKYGFTPDSDFPVVYGEKGITQVVVSKNIKFKNIISIKAGLATNIVIGKATFKVNNINQIKNKLKLKHKIKGDEITFYGVSAHGSSPKLGKNAFLLGLKELAKINNDKEALKLAEAFLDYSGKKINANYRSKLLGEITFSLGIATYQNNQLTLSIDCRRPENANHQVVVNKILKSFNFKLKSAKNMDPLLVNPKSDFIQLLMDAYQKETGDYKSKPIYIGGGTYAKEVKNVVAFGAQGKVNFNMHQDSEFIPIKELYNLLSIYAHAIMNLIKLK